MPRVVHFEISADDPKRAIEFYRDVFGWKAEKWEGPEDYWLLMTGKDEQPGINGGIMQRKPDMPGIVNTIDVQSYDDYKQKILERGGKIVVDRMEVPEVGTMGYFMDTEGNMFGIMQMDPAAMEKMKAKHEAAQASYSA